MPLDYSRYPRDWKLRSLFIRKYRSRGKCEFCGAANGEPNPKTGSIVVLTVAHVYNKNLYAAGLLNLAALCQACHLALDLEDHKAAARETRNRRRKLRPLPFPP